MSGHFVLLSIFLLAARSLGKSAHLGGHPRGRIEVLVVRGEEQEQELLIRGTLKLTGGCALLCFWQARGTPPRDAFGGTSRRLVWHTLF